MYSKETVVKVGLLARPATEFVKRANEFNAQITLEIEGQRVSAKSLMGVMSLKLDNGMSVTVAAEGDEDESAVEALAEFLSGE